jgi:beta-lactam-binding protein with PASTA domain
VGGPQHLGPRGATVAHWVVAAALVSLVSFLLVALPRSSAVAAPALQLDPSTGPPGTPVDVTANGFEDCVPSTEGVDEGGGETVEPRTEDEGDTTPGTVTFTWDSTDAVGASKPVSGGAAATRLVVPTSASLTGHTVTATCDQNPKLAVTTPFKVTPPAQPPVPVPDIVGRSLPDARALLETARLTTGRVAGTGAIVQQQAPAAGTAVPVGTPVDLVLGTPPPLPVTVPRITGLTVADARQRLTRHSLSLGSVSGHGGVIKAQVPGAFTRVTPGSPVDVTLAPVAPRQVQVPDLLGSDVGDAPRLLAARGLSLGQVTGDGDIVRGQRPAAGTLVPRDTAVSLSVEPGLQPPRLVSVPHLVGKTVKAAAAALARAGLQLGNPHAGGTGTVERQQPAAGVLVPRHSVVTVSVDGEPAPTPTPTPTPAPTHSALPPKGSHPDPPGTSLAARALVLAAGAAALLGAAAAAYQVARGRRGRAWVQTHVRAVPGGVTVGHLRAERREGDPRRRDVTTRIEPHPDIGIHVIEEISR